MRVDEALRMIAPLVRDTCRISATYTGDIDLFRFDTADISNTPGRTMREGLLFEPQSVSILPLLPPRTLYRSDLQLMR